MLIHWEGRDYHYSMDDIDVPQAMAIKAHTGMNLRPWLTALADGDALAMQGLLYCMKAQNGERAQIAELNLKLTRLSYAYGDAVAREQEAMQAAREASGQPDPTPAAGEGGSLPTPISAPSEPNT